MKKLLSLALVLTMLFTIISVPSVSAAVVEDATADAEGFKTVYLHGYEDGNKSPAGGTSNFYTSEVTATVEGNATSQKNLESVTTYADAKIDKPVSPIGEAFGDNVLYFDYSYGDKQTVTDCSVAIYKIQNQVTFVSGATYRASFWIRIDDTDIDGDYAILNNPELYISNTVASKSSCGSIATAAMGDRVIRRGEWTKVGMTFTTNDKFISVANNGSYGWGIKWTMDSETYGTTVKGYLDNFQLEELDTRTREVESNYFYYEGFDNAVTGSSLASHPYYNSYFTPSYPKPTDAATTPTWKTRAKVVPFGSGDPNYAVEGTQYYSGGSSLLTSLETAKTTGGNYISDIFHGDFTSADDIGRKFRISAMVYPVSTGATTAPADGGKSAHFLIALGGSDGVSSSSYACKYRDFDVAQNGMDIEWDKWNEISTVFEVTADHVLQTSVTDAEVAETKAYQAVNAVRINQSGSENVTTEFWTDDYIVRELKKYTISATSNDTTFGTVTGGGEIWEDEETTLTATANDTYEFIGWYLEDELVSEEETINVSNPTADAAYIAHFISEETKFNVNLLTVGEGSVEGAGSFSYGTEVTVNATPGEGYVFDGWYDSDTDSFISSNTSYKFTVAEDKTLEACFIKTPVGDWSEIYTIGFEGETNEDRMSPATALNFWGQNESGGNSKSTYRYSTYEDEGMTAPSGFGTDMLVLDWTCADETTSPSVTGVATGRINNVPNSIARFYAGDKYKLSFQIYIVETFDDTLTTSPLRVYYSNADGTASTLRFEQDVIKGEWVTCEMIATIPEGHALLDETGSGIRFVFTEEAARPKIAYIDNVKLEKFAGDDLSLEITDVDSTVTATATVNVIKSGDTVDAIVIIAAYDAEGKLVGVSFSNNGESKPLAIDETISATYTKAEGIDSYVAFLWDDLTRIRPYTMPKTLGE